MSLLEVVIAMGVTAIALAGAVLAVRSQEQAYHSGNRLRAAQGAVRSAMLVLEQKLPLAGFGMDAPLAIDLGWYDPVAAGLCPGELAPCSRDRVDDSDELVFYARNPSYWVDPAPGAAANSEPKGHAWNLTAVGGNDVTVKARAGDVFRAGQILQVVCAGSLRYAYVTLSGTTVVPIDGAQILQLRGVVASNPFLRQDVAATLPCVSPAILPNAKVFLIDRYRFHVLPVAVPGGLDPYLALDTGTDTNLDGRVDADDEVLVAEGIESLQVGWVLADPTLPTVGTATGTGIAYPDGAVAVADATPQTIVRTNFPGPLDSSGFVYSSSSFFSYSLVTLPPQRKTNAQGNIRRALISVVGRSADPDATGHSNLSWGANSPLLTGNQSGAPPWITSAAAARGGDDGYQRAFAETAVNLPNMTARTLIYY
jgi:type IV pilus assembly protein PilW